ncbi:MAG: WecB/TagA/CpsF family glycosyltransferase [Prevotella sp.]|nr:WecB/TagA/CpsF family glycosyltransferase [Prevotella sp.]MCI6804888.1 WecB/TagA/CpsF family glycosyltransferase [Prevotella sp.]MDY3073499.1 WecB/TagA/CpsF family glycosyltransferase [Prevotella sp.]
MRMKLKDLDILTSRAELAKLPEGKLLINTINAFSYDNARKDVLFSEALQKGDVLIPDGISIVKACRFLNAKSQPKERIAGWDLFVYEMEKLNRVGGRVMFLGSSDAVLNLIRQRVAEKYPKIEVDTYSPPYKPVFSDEENEAMISAINHSNPDLLWIGMTAPKQEKWAYTHLDRLDVHCHIGTIGAVFDFFAGTVKRAPERWQRVGLEWLYRLLSEPRRMWRRYFIGNAKFIYYIMVEKIM